MRNTFIIFIVSGFWHGANWTFIVWGFLNALYIMPSIIFNTNRNNLDIAAQGKLFPSVKEIFSIALTFTLTVFAWIFFRAENVQHAFSYIAQIFSSSLFTAPDFPGIGSAKAIVVLVFLCFFTEWLQRTRQHALQFAPGSPLKSYSLVLLNSVIIWVIILWGAFGNKSFIYFQF